VILLSWGIKRRKGVENTASAYPGLGKLPGRALRAHHAKFKGNGNLHEVATIKTCCTVNHQNLVGPWGAR
jgi:hypothetical protein